MREIKFRALEIDTANVILGFPFYEAGYDYLGNPVKRWYMFDEGDTRKREVCEGTLSEFTGLTDRNGVEVFEYDVLRSHHFTNTDGSKEYLHHIVKWSERYNGWFCLNATSMDEKDGSLQLWVYAKNSDFEVIGNIHEHPHILDH